MPAGNWTGAIALAALAVGSGRAWAVDSPAEAPAPRLAPNDAARLIAEAERAERDGRWDQALEFYLLAYVSDRSSVELRERIRICHRKANQLRRHRDPVFQQFVLSLPVADSLNLYGEAITKLSTLFADRERAAPARLFGIGIDELDRALGDPSFRDRHLDRTTAARIQKFQRSLRDDWRHRLPTNAREVRQAAKELVADAQDLLGVRTPSAVVFELLCGACTGLDEYTVYVTPTAAQAELASPIVEFAEYGVLIRVSGNELIVDGIVPGSWAALHTGLRKEDRVVRVNGRVPVAGNPASLAEAMRGAGMDGHILELASADMNMPPPIVRLPVPVPTVYGLEVVNTQERIGYLRIGALRDSTPRELDDAIYQLKAQGIRAVIVDLRGNAGGLFTAGIEIAQRFLPAGIIVTTKGQAPEFAGRVFSSDSGMLASDLPLVVLVDTRTMSAAEAIAAAWKDHNRATLVGLPTFGKGVIQSPIRLTAADGPEGNLHRSGILILTVANMFGPRGGAINGTGVTPHIVEPDPNRQLPVAIAKAAELVATGRHGRGPE